MAVSGTRARPCGSWSSSISSERIAAGALRLAQPRLDGGWVYWLEGRPAEGGRQAILRGRPAPGGAVEEVTPPDVHVRTRVHEYGGGDYGVWDGRVLYVELASQAIHATRGAAPSCAAGSSHADLALSPDGRWLVAVEERPRPHPSEAQEPENRLVVFAADGSDALRPVAEGHDFVSSPRFSPDGRQLAFLAWEHPAMPWDETRLYVQAWGAGGPEGAPRPVAGGAGESIFQPEYSPQGRLTFVSDRTGWWNLYQFDVDVDVDVGGDGAGARPLCPREAEFGRPQWAFAMSCYAFVDEDSILCRYGVAGFDRLARLDLESGHLDDLPLDYTWVDGVRVEGSLACFLGASPTRAAEVVTLDLVGGNATPVRSSLGFDLDSAELSRPESIEFVSAGGRKAYAFFYPPVSGRFEPAPGERPPLLVKSHGGPTAAASPALDLGIQYWTSRGFGVVDVNYGGSTGYGRAYRDRLLGQWGVVDVEDCIHAALHLADAGRVDRERLAIRGGSAGGYTVLCALTFHDVFAAGASHYGIGDLEALDRDTHKFESRYTQQLVAPDPEGEGREVYRARSPIHAADRLSCPVIFFQGLDDPIVPPSQAEAMAKALERRGIPHALVLFEGERHGFQRAENIRTALDGELYFYSQVFGFEVDVPTHVVDAVRIVGGSPAA